MCFRLIEAEKAKHPVSLLCSVLGVLRYVPATTPGKRRPLSERRLRDLELLGLIKQNHAESEGSYGWPRMYAELRHRGVTANRKRLARLMRQAGLSGLITPTGKTTIRVPGCGRRHLVGRQFQPAAPNQVWAADLTEIATWYGKLYLAVIVDCFSRRCVGWAMADHLRAELVVEALETAIWHRKPEPGLVHHSDQGSQYVSLLFGQSCRKPASTARGAPRAARSTTQSARA